MNNIYYIQFKDLKCYNDPNGVMGHLTPIESEADIPFEIRRIYYITGVPEEVQRGNHAHKKLQQVLVCLKGSVKILVDNSVEKETICLSDATKGLYIGPSVWRVMYDFLPDSVLLVLASDHYDEDDYFRDYNKFSEWAKGGGLI